MAGACVLGLLIAAPATAAGFTFEASAGIGDYIVAKIAVPAGKREWISVHGVVCADGQTSPGATNGFVAMRAVNGAVTGYTLWLGGYHLNLRQSPGSATAAGHQISPTLPLVAAEGHCGESRDTFVSPVGPVEMVVVGMSLSPRSTIYVNSSGDPAVTLAHGLAKTKNQFDEGLHASVYGGPQAVETGVLLRQSVLTTVPSVGWFWPAISGAGHTSSTCYRNGLPCPPPVEDSLYILSSQPPTEWAFEIEDDLRVAEAPYYALGIIELE